MTTASDRTTALAEKLRAKAASRATRTVGEDQLLVPVAEPPVSPPAVTLAAPVVAEIVRVAADLAIQSVSQPGVTAAQPTEPLSAGPLLPTGLAPVLVSEAPADSQPPTAPVRALVAPARTKSRTRPASTATERSGALAVPVRERSGDAVPRPVAGPTGQLAASGESVRKLTLELPPFVIDAVNRWERDALAAGQQRVYRERLIDCALAGMSTDIASLIARARELAPWIRAGEPEQMGTRVRDSVHNSLKTFKPELRLSRERGVFLRDLYAVALIDYLLAIGVPVEWPPVQPPTVD